MGKLQVTQVRSENGEREGHRRTIRALGLRGLGDTVVHEETPQVRGMIEAVQHLVAVEDVEE